MAVTEDQRLCGAWAVSHAGENTQLILRGKHKPNKKGRRGARYRFGSRLQRTVCSIQNRFLTKTIKTPMDMYTQESVRSVKLHNYLNSRTIFSIGLIHFSVAAAQGFVWWVNGDVWQHHIKKTINPGFHTKTASQVRDRLKPYCTGGRANHQDHPQGTLENVSKTAKCYHLLSVLSNSLGRYVNEMPVL